MTESPDKHMNSAIFWGLLGVVAFGLITAAMRFGEDPSRSFQMGLMYWTPDGEQTTD